MAILSSKSDQKAAQLQNSTIQPDEKSRITSDYGVRQMNTDDWLRVANQDKTGPMLLEDPFGREKVRFHSCTSLYRCSLPPFTNIRPDPPV